jgi:hypothetical protein
MVRKQELENSIDETHWVKINAKGQSFLLCNTYRAQWTDLDYYSILVYAIELAALILTQCVSSMEFSNSCFLTIRIVSLA